MTLRSHGIARFWKKLGPGLITGASDDDPSGIATYSQAGAQFGLSFLWSAFLTYPLMYAVQEMCARIGIVTGTGLAGVLRKHYPPFLLYLLMCLVIPSIILNIAADLSGMGAVVNMLFPSIPKLAAWAVTLLTTFFLIMDGAGPSIWMGPGLRSFDSQGLGIAESKARPHPCIPFSIYVSTACLQFDLLSNILFYLELKIAIMISCF